MNLEYFDVVITAVLKRSFLQGGVFISEANWLQKYPGQEAHGILDFNNGNDRSTSHLEDRLFNYGVQSQATSSRLAAFDEVENTYLSIFQVLGGMGVLLGSLGLLIVILRNLWERRARTGHFTCSWFFAFPVKKNFREEIFKL